jgi:hypothetical protein
MASTRTTTALLTVPATRAVRRITIDPGEVPDLPDDGGDLPESPPQPAVSFPDLFFQFAPCLEDLDDPKTIGNEGDPKPVKAAIRAAQGGGFADYACSAGTGRLGWWESVPNEGVEPEANQRGLLRLDPLHGITAFGSLAILIRREYVERLAARQFAAAPKRYNVAGEVDSNGRVHIEGFGVAFVAPDVIATSIRGAYDAPAPLANKPFVIELRDRLFAAGNHVGCETEVRVTLAGGIWDRMFGPDLLGALATLVTVPGSGLAALARLGQRLAEGIIEAVLTPDEASEPPLLIGAGGTVAGLFEPDLPIPGTTKLVFNYDELGDLPGVSVDSSALVVRGTVNPAPRVPVVEIDYHRLIPSPIAVPGGGLAVPIRCRIVPDDLRAPLRIAWTADRGRILNPTSRQTDIFVPFNGNPVRIGVSVTDADGLRAQAEVVVPLG